MHVLCTCTISFVFCANLICGDLGEAIQEEIVGDDCVCVRGDRSDIFLFLVLQYDIP